MKRHIWSDLARRPEEIYWGLQTPARRLGSFLGRFAADTRAVTAVEFGFVSLPFFALLIALMQTGAVVLAERTLDGAVDAASRQILTGQAQSGGMTSTAFGNLVCGKTMALFTCNKLMVNVQTYATFNPTNANTPTLTYDANGNVTNNWLFNTGSANDIVVVQVMYQWPVFLGPMGFNLTNLSNGNRLLISTVVFKNEPYS